MELSTMRQMLGIALVLAAAGCRGPAEPRIVSTPPLEVSSPVEVVLKIGQEARVDMLLRLDLLGVSADSRCPATAECFWAGDGAVATAHAIGMGPSYPDTLHTTLDPTSVQFGGYTITLLELTPYPQSFEPIPSDQYAARFRVERSPKVRAPD
jgi:hypothetical protein